MCVLGGKQISLADAEDLVETFKSINAVEELKVLHRAISAAYMIHYDPF